MQTEEEIRLVIDNYYTLLDTTEYAQIREMLLLKICVLEWVIR